MIIARHHVRQGLRSTIVAAALSLPLAPVVSWAQALPAPAPQVEQSPAAAATPMRIVGVEWRIKKGQESEFLEYWSTRSTIPDRSASWASS
jgi:hypothetical protein